MLGNLWPELCAGELLCNENDGYDSQRQLCFKALKEEDAALSVKRLCAERDLGGGVSSVGPGSRCFEVKIWLNKVPCYGDPLTRCGVGDFKSRFPSRTESCTCLQERSRSSNHLLVLPIR